MSEYELVDLFNSLVQGMLAIFMAFVSTTSAFLVATYLAAPKFSRFLARVTVALYAVTALTLIGLEQRQAQTLVDLRTRMRDVIDWHPASYEAPWIAPTATYSVVGLMVLLFTVTEGEGLFNDPQDIIDKKNQMLVISNLY